MRFRAAPCLLAPARTEPAALVNAPRTVETLALMGKKRGAFGSLAFLSVSVIILNQGLGPKLGTDSVMETPGFKAGLLQHREGLRTGSCVAAWV